MVAVKLNTLIISLFVQGNSLNSWITFGAHLDGIYASTLVLFYPLYTWLQFSMWKTQSGWSMLFIYNFVAVVLRMLSFGYDYHWSQLDSHFDQEKHVMRCSLCKLGKTCYVVRQVDCVAPTIHFNVVLLLRYLFLT
jgi:hypothetical protein